MIVFALAVISSAVAVMQALQEPIPDKLTVTAAVELAELRIPGSR